MRRICMMFIGMVFVLTGCARGPEEKTLTIVNVSGIGAEPLESIRAYAEKELKVPVRTVALPKLAGKGDFQTLEKAALKKKHANDVAYILVAELDGDEHLNVNADRGIAIINAKALYTPDAKLFTGRIRRMVMRAAAFSFGLKPTPDPFCVTREYTSLEELDRMGNNYSPPLQMWYAEEAAKRGLRTVEPAVEVPPFAR